ncbi:unnamed protein product [Phytophthora lilii]|uniref:Unnamed protein product n=1 Tax=Phytophthora lilii TaxID=2077276 RepID=A0A9W6XPX4_9STRA|nr:unnamed protein product [Phytophthora lilii]
MDETPLCEILLQYGDVRNNDVSVEASPANSNSTQGSVQFKLQGYVNRILKSAIARQAEANITTNLSSHSLWRGGAQHANGDSELMAQWIFDRGNWNMTATNKAFAYALVGNLPTSVRSL